MKNANGQLSGSEGRRSSFSDKSEEGSPTRTRAQNQAKLAAVQEVSSSRHSLSHLFVSCLEEEGKTDINRMRQTETRDCRREAGRV